MKALTKIEKIDYDSGRDFCLGPETLEENVGQLLFARFWVTNEDIAVESIMSVRRAGESLISFQLVNNDAQLIGNPYTAPVNEEGIIGALALRDGRVLHAQEGYLVNYGSSLEDALTDSFALEVGAPFPVHVTLGGAAGDQARRELELARTAIAA